MGRTNNVLESSAVKYLTVRIVAARCIARGTEMPTFAQPVNGALQLIKMPLKLTELGLANLMHTRPATSSHPPAWAISRVVATGYPEGVQQDITCQQVSTY